MSKIEIDISEPEGDNSDAELSEIREELAVHIEETEEALEEGAENVASELTEFKEEVQSWLEKALQPIAAAISTLSDLTGTLALKVATLETPPLTLPASEPETLNATNTETSNSSETEHPPENEVENPALAEVAETLDNPLQSIARVITKL